MRTLIISRTKDYYYTLPLEKQIELTQGAAAFIDKYRGAGKCRDAYFLPNLKGSVSIWETESAEEGSRLFLENPMTPFMDEEVMVVVEWDAGLRIMRETATKY